jgi:hypothetical protein
MTNVDHNLAIVRRIEGGTSPRLTASTDISEFACSSLRHLMNFHIEGCLTTTDWFHALWKPEEKNEKTIISNFILMKTVNVTSIVMQQKTYTFLKRV